MKQLIIFLLLCLNFTASSIDPIAIFNIEKEKTIAIQEVEFWKNKLAISNITDAYRLKLAQAYTNLYDLSGEVNVLYQAEELLREVVLNEGVEKTSALLGLAQNLITQHRFCEAYDAVIHAESIGVDKRKVALVKYDVETELGINSNTLSRVLAQKKDIQYLIRFAKQKDAEGKLNDAIYLLTEALEAARFANNKQMELWISTNLAEFLGHDGQIEASRNMLLSVLERDPSNWYALKLLAWIAYSHDNDIITAWQYLDAISKNRNTPEILLMKSEIIEYAGGHSEFYLEEFLDEVNLGNYGVMYNRYIIELFLDGDNDQKQKALEIAGMEVSERQTSETYALLAYAHYKNKNIEKSKEIFTKEVYQKTFEPVALSYMLEAFHDDMKIKNELSKELIDIQFEMGPLKAEFIDGLRV